MIQITADETYRIITVTRDDGLDLDDNEARAGAEDYLFLDLAWEFHDIERINYNKVKVSFRR